VSAQRKALIIANDEYEHEGLGRLLAPAADAQALAAVLGAEQVGDFDVRVVRNEPAHVIQAQLEELFSEARPDDLLLLHFSCHGLKNESGELFFATTNTRPNRLGSTAVSADFVQRCMRTSRSRSVVLLLDCCYGGAFAQGVTVRAAGDVDVLGSFPHERAHTGRGRAVISASSAMEYAFEGDRLADDAAARPSVFTTALVEGLETGDADRDQDGWVSLDELYDYVFDKVRERNPHQTPSRDVEMQGDLFIARRRHPVTAPAALPPELLQAIDSSLAGIRTGAVQELTRVLRGGHAGRALAARLALENLAQDDSRQVSAAAAAVLRSPAPAPPPPSPPVAPLPVTVSAAAQPTEMPPSAPAAARPSPAGAAVLGAGPSEATVLEAGPAEAAVLETGPYPAVPASGAAATALEPPAVQNVQVIQEPVVPVAPVTPVTPMTKPEPAARAQVAASEATRHAEPPGRPGPVADLRLRVAGVLAVIEAILLAVIPWTPFVGPSSYRLISYAALTQQILIDSAITLAAGVCLLVPRTSRLIGAGLILGAVAVVPGDVFLVLAVRQVSGTTGPGMGLVFISEALGVIAAVLAGSSLWHARAVRVQPRSLIGRRPGQAASWLVIGLGAVGAAALVLQVGSAASVPGLEVDISHQLMIPMIWFTFLAVAIPAIAAAAAPRPFGAALIGGWLCAALGDVSFLTGFRSGVFGYTLVLLAIALIPFLRTAPAGPSGRPAARADRRLAAAGTIAVLAAVMLVLAPNELFGPTYNLFDNDANKQQILIMAAGALAAGVCLLIPASSRLAGAGLALGAAAAVPGNAALVIVVVQEGSAIRAGDWLVVGAEVLIIIAAVLAGLAVRRDGAVRLAPRALLARHPGQSAAWLVAALGLAGAVAFLVQVSAQTQVPGQGGTTAAQQLIIPLAWTTLMALVIPVLAAAARPRPFGAALAGGWIIGIFAEVAFVTPFPVSVFGYTLIALAVALVPFVRTAHRGEPGDVTGLVSSRI
jgi:uncharacterized membrane protein